MRYLEQQQPKRFPPEIPEGLRGLPREAISFLVMLWLAVRNRRVGGYSDGNNKHPDPDIPGLN